MWAPYAPPTNAFNGVPISHYIGDQMAMIRPVVLGQWNDDSNVAWVSRMQHSPKPVEEYPILRNGENFLPHSSPVDVSGAKVGNNVMLLAPANSVNNSKTAEISPPFEPYSVIVGENRINYYTPLAKESPTPPAASLPVAPQVPVLLVVQPRPETTPLPPEGMYHLPGNLGSHFQPVAAPKHAPVMVAPAHTYPAAPHVDSHLRTPGAVIIPQQNVGGMGSSLRVRKERKKEVNIRATSTTFQKPAAAEIYCGPQAWVNRGAGWEAITL